MIDIETDPVTDNIPTIGKNCFYILNGVDDNDTPTDNMPNNPVYTGTFPGSFIAGVNDYKNSNTDSDKNDENIDTDCVINDENDENNVDSNKNDRNSHIENDENNDDSDQNDEYNQPTNIVGVPEITGVPKNNNNIPIHISTPLQEYLKIRTIFPQIMPECSRILIKSQ